MGSSSTPSLVAFHFHQPNSPLHSCTKCSHPAIKIKTKTSFQTSVPTTSQTSVETLLYFILKFLLYVFISFLCCSSSHISFPFLILNHTELPLVTKVSQSFPNWQNPPKRMTFQHFNISCCCDLLSKSCQTKMIPNEMTNGSRQWICRWTCFSHSTPRMCRYITIQMTGILAGLQELFITSLHIQTRK